MKNRVSDGHALRFGKQADFSHDLRRGGRFGDWSMGFMPQRSDKSVNTFVFQRKLGSEVDAVLTTYFAAWKFGRKLRADG